MSNKNFMNLSKKECLIVAQEAFSNGESKYQDGLALVEQRNSFGSATSLLIESMEENMKGVILFLDGNGFQFRSRVKGIHNLFNNHQLRFPLALVLSTINLFIGDMKRIIIGLKEKPDQSKKLLNMSNDQLDSLVIPNIVDMAKRILDEIHWFSNANYLRVKGTYVDYVNELKSPLNISRDDFNLVHRRILSLREFVNEILPCFANDGHPLLVEQLSRIQDQFISERWYDSIEKAISDFKASDSMEVLVENIKKFIEEMDIDDTEPSQS